MSIREHDGKHLLQHTLYPTASLRVVQVNFEGARVEDFSAIFKNIETECPWVLTCRLVCKPDQLIKRRGKNGLLGINLDWISVKEWISSRTGKEVVVDGVDGVLETFIVEEFCKHDQGDEYYVCIQSTRDGDLVYFTHEGGVDVGDVDAKAIQMLIGVDEAFPMLTTVEQTLLRNVEVGRRGLLSSYLERLYKAFVKLQFNYLEVNPLVVVGEVVYMLDLAAKIDTTSAFECSGFWSEGLTSCNQTSLVFPPPFGRKMTVEERYISDLDSRTGASLKLTILNQEGSVWTLVAGGGASVAYADAIAASGYASELANYGEYSGAPNEAQTYSYARTVLSLMTRGDVLSNGKILFIGGGIANFTNVASTFKGIVKALREFGIELKRHGVRVFVRRGGPNYEEGLREMRVVGREIGVEMQVFGPEMHVTGIVPLAFKSLKSTTLDSSKLDSTTKDSTTKDSTTKDTSKDTSKESNDLNLKVTNSCLLSLANNVANVRKEKSLFDTESQSFVYGLQPRAIQGMLDFDFMSLRKTPSVVCMIYPFGGHHVQKFYWGTKETLIPVYTTIQEACKMFPKVDIVVNFASFRSAFDSTKDLLQVDQIKVVAVIAEGVPERRARSLAVLAKSLNKVLIGPATVGGIRAGSFKIGNTGGMMDNIVSSKLYRKGSVCYVSKSGGMSNELNNIISRNSDGVLEGVAIGGDKYPGTTFIDHIRRFEDDPECKMIVVLGEVGGVEEYAIVDAISKGHLKKPIVAWCIGTCASLFKTEVQFGHAGAFANSKRETAVEKNRALEESGVLVPHTFEGLPELIKLCFDTLVKFNVVTVKAEVEVPQIPVDYAWAQELGLIRKPASFITTICDDRGQELYYSGMSITEIFKEDIGIGGVLSLLWFKRRLPLYATKFIEMVLMLTADHGPAVSGAHNTIVTARAGKDLVSSLVAGLLTIGDRFGGALDGAAKSFSTALDTPLSPAQFVKQMRDKHLLILGIGHKVKSLNNPDLRVQIVKDYVLKEFPNTECFRFAIEVEKITTAKKDNLILNVDGAVGVAFVDLLRGCGCFTTEECEEYLNIGALNGLFVLGRSIGFIGHFLDQKRLKQGLYRHPWDDISYMMDEGVSGGRMLAKGEDVEKVVMGGRS